MKLATYKDGSRDGQLVVVARDLGLAHYATGIATRLQQVLDDWNFIAPQLEDLYTTLNHGKARHAFAFEPRQCMAPLPRAFQWADGSTYPSHGERVALARQAAEGRVTMSPPADPRTVRLYQGGSDDLLGPCDDAWFGAESWDIDLEAELAVVTGDVAMGAGPEQGLDGVRLLMLVNDWSLRGLVRDELAKGFGFLQSKPATAFGPVAVTPDELGDAWRHGRASLTLQVAVNGRRLGLLDAGADMAVHFGELVAHLAKTRNVRAGSIVGGGTVSNRDAAKGVGCLIEQRALEQVEHGEARTGWLRFGDTVRIDAKGRDGQSLFGAIEQRVTGPGWPPEVDASAEDEADGHAPAGPAVAG